MQVLANLWINCYLFLLHTMWSLTCPTVYATFSQWKFCHKKKLFVSLMLWLLVKAVINRADLGLQPINYYYKALHLGCCSSPRSASASSGWFVILIVESVLKISSKSKSKSFFWCRKIEWQRFNLRDTEEREITYVYQQQQDCEGQDR